MNIFQECGAALRLVVTGETTCRLCLMTAPIVWVFGSFYLGVKAITIYATCDYSALTIILLSFGLFMIICGVFSASNTIHFCIQVPTSSTALEIQKYMQTVVVGIFVIIMGLSWMVFEPDNSEKCIVREGVNGKEAFYELLWQEFTFLGLFTLTTISCIVRLE